MRTLSNGNVLVNDRVGHRVLLLDSALRMLTIVADTAGESAEKFGSGQGGLIPYLRDTSLFVDRASRTLVVISPGGEMQRAIATPRQTDFDYFAGTQFGIPGFDGKGRLFYRAATPPGPRQPMVQSTADTSRTKLEFAPIVRADFESRAIDTIATIKIVQTRFWTTRLENRTYKSVNVTNPLSIIDAWALLPDGTVAVIRGQDYHVDWYLPDGSHHSTPKMPFNWKPLSDADKRARVDSAQHVLDSLQTMREAAQKKAGDEREQVGCARNSISTLGTRIQQ